MLILVVSIATQSALVTAKRYPPPKSTPPPVPTPTPAPTSAPPLTGTTVFQDGFESDPYAWAMTGTTAQVSSPVAIGTRAAMATGPAWLAGTRVFG